MFGVLVWWRNGIEADYAFDSIEEAEAFYASAGGMEVQLYDGLFGDIIKCRRAEWKEEA